MRTIILVSLALCVFGEVGFGGVFHKDESPRKKLRRIELTIEQAAELKEITSWLDQNIDQNECPERAYYSVYEKNRKATLLGYQIVAECPDAPSPQISLLFDAEQNFIEN